LPTAIPATHDCPARDTAPPRPVAATVVPLVLTSSSSTKGSLVVARVIREMADWADVAPEVEMRLESWVSSRSRSCTQE
jgi:hypothetical protein